MRDPSVRVHRSPKLQASGHYQSVLVRANPRDRLPGLAPGSEAKPGQPQPLRQVTGGCR